MGVTNTVSFGFVGAGAEVEVEPEPELALEVLLGAVCTLAPRPVRYS